MNWAAFYIDDRDFLPDYHHAEIFDSMAFTVINETLIYEALAPTVRTLHDLASMQPVLIDLLYAFACVKFRIDT